MTRLKRGVCAALALALTSAVLVAMPSDAAEPCTGNAIACENLLPGTPASVWDINGRGDDSIQGFASQMSVNAGSPVQFKIDTDARAYTIKIYRLGFYQGNGARLVTTINPSAPLPQNQVPCATDATTQIFDCGTWAVSATWNVPSTAVSGVYIAHLIRTDHPDQTSHIPFVVRNDNNTSQALFQTSDTTWQAYNTYGGSNYYYGGANGRSFKASYNRPFSTRDIGNGRDYLFSNEYPMIRFLEQNGVDVSYVSAQDTAVDSALLTKHKMFMSVGHDEYWSQEQRANVTAARDAGVNLAFFGGNDVYWKTRWEPSQDGTQTANRTLVCYKDTWANKDNGPIKPLDPVTPTATWRDPRFGDLGFGPENSLLGTQYQANTIDLAIKVDANEGKMRLWRNSALATLAAGSTATLAAHTVGYESDEDVDNGYRPAGLIRLSTTTGPTPELLTDFGNTVVSGTTTHHVTQYRAASGALVFSAGTVQWAWGLDSNHDGLDVQAADPRIRQGTLNLLADMSVDATTLAADLAPASKSTDSAPPSSTITKPSGPQSVTAGDLVTVEGTASDVGGIVAGVEVSVDGGATFHPAQGRTTFSYTGVQIGTGDNAIQVRAIDDSGNIQAAPTTLAVQANCPCTVFGGLSPTNPATTDAGAVTVGTRFKAAADGFISGIRFYKGPGNTGTHIGTLYGPDGAIATATFSNETASGWQTANFSNAVPVTAGTVYTAAYFAPNGHYAADQYFFSYRPYSSGALSALGGAGDANANGVFAYNNQRPGEASRQTNYYVDAVWNATDVTPLSVTAVSPLGESTSVPTDSQISATFSRGAVFTQPATPGSVKFTVMDGADAPISGQVSYDAATKTAKFEPDQPLAVGTRYTVTVTGTATSGASMAAPYQFSFTTAKAPNSTGACPCTVFADSDHPTNPPESETSLVQLGMAFTSRDSGTISGVRFYKAGPNEGPHSIALWTATGTQLATAAVTNESTAGWQQADFATPVSISANTTYIASYLAPKGRYSAAAGGLAASQSNGPLSTVATGGRYVYNGSAAPLTKSSANYFVDPVFNRAPGQPPTVVATTPGTGAKSVPVSTAIRATFNTNVQPGSTTLVVTRVSDGAVVAGNTANETAGATVSFAPTGILDPATKYSVSVSGATSTDGVAMTGPFTTSFTTSGAAACPCSLLETTTVPELSDAGDSSPTTLGLKFSPTVDGYVKGLRYYRDDANTGTHLGSLWSSDGERKGSLTFTDSGSGWQTANFSTPVAVQAGQTYIASYYAPNGHYAAATGYFNAPVSNVPLVSVGSGGVYANGNGFPTLSYLNTNYYVDVSFSTTDDDPPNVTAITPAAGATAVPVDTLVTATFDRAITTASLIMTLTGPGDQPVGGQVDYDPVSRKATFTAAAPLATATAYTASVSAHSSSGVDMVAPRTWSFTTAAPVLEVGSVSPVDNAVNVPATSSVSATFTTPIAAGSQVMTLKNAAGSAVTGTTTYDATTRTATFKPSAALTNYTTYTATATAKTPAGVAMTSPRTWSFTTADTIAPTVSAVNPTDNRTAVSPATTVTATFARAIDAGSLVVTLTGPGGSPVAGNTTYVPATRVATFTPSQALASLTRYTTTVTAKNPSGVVIASPRTWAFTTADADPVTVTATSPTPGASGVATNARVTATFSKAITSGSQSVTLKNAAGVAVSGSTSYNSTSRVVTFTPTNALTSSTVYTASVTARSAAGVAMPAATTWSFTTVAQAYSLYTTGQRPATTTGLTSTPTTVGVQFSSSRSGQVTAIRYYASLLNTGKTVTLWSADGTVLGTATTTESGTGWRTATFATPLPLTAGTSYMASVYAPVGRLSTTNGSYNSAYTAGPLTVPASGARSSTGNVFPTTPSTTNFWVDILTLI